MTNAFIQIHDTESIVLFLSGLIFCIFIPILFRKYLKKPILTFVLLTVVWLFLNSYFLLTPIYFLSFDMGILEKGTMMLTLETLIGTGLSTVVLKKGWNQIQPLKFGLVPMFVLITTPLVVSILLNPIFNTEFSSNIFSDSPLNSVYTNFTLAGLSWQLAFYIILSKRKLCI